MDELALLRAVGTRLPPIPHATAVVNRVLKPVFLRRRRPPVVAEVHGFLMELDPHESTDAAYLFYPQLYDREELAFLRGVLRPGDTFVDVGSHIGYYALFADRLVGPTGRVVAIEADPVNFARLVKNVELNSARVAAVNMAVSDRTEVRHLYINAEGNRGGNSLIRPHGSGTEVRCQQLGDILSAQGVAQIRAMKLDIEGMEFAVLRSFLESAGDDGHPEAVIVEYSGDWVRRSGGDVVELLMLHGYRVALATRENRVLTRKGISS